MEAPSVFGLDEGAARLLIFVAILLAMTVLEALLPRRRRRHRRAARWTTNFGVLVSDFLAVSAMTFLVPVTAVLTALWAEASGVGLFNAVAVPAWLQWLVVLVALDFTVWAQHVATHKVPLLWRVHRVHHVDEDLDASTAVRFHPLEIILSIFVKSAAVLLLGAPAAAVVAFEALVNGAALFNHANLKLSPALDRLLRLVLVTPDMHRIHHSSERAETDSNYGFALPWWDRLFGTYRAEPEKGHDGMVLGLSEWQRGEANGLRWTLLLPFRNPPVRDPPEDGKEG